MRAPCWRILLETAEVVSRAWDDYMNEEIDAVDMGPLIGNLRGAVRLCNAKARPKEEHHHAMGDWCTRCGSCGCCNECCPCQPEEGKP